MPPYTVEDLLQKPMSRKDYWIMLYPDGSPVALDNASGGYPYRAHSLKSVHFWLDLQEATRYKETMLKENFSIYRVTQVLLTEVYDEHL